MQNIILYIIFGIVVGGVFGIVLSVFSRCKNSKPRMNKKKVENLKKIEKLLQSKNKIKNADIEKLLGVSDATATRYLDQLEKSNKLTQHGKGKATYYTK